MRERFAGTLCILFLERVMVALKTISLQTFRNVENEWALFIGPPLLSQERIHGETANLSRRLKVV